MTFRYDRVPVGSNTNIIHILINIITIYVCMCACNPVALQCNGNRLSPEVIRPTREYHLNRLRYGPIILLHYYRYLIMVRPSCADCGSNDELEYTLYLQIKKKNKPMLLVYCSHSKDGPIRLRL